KNQQPAEGATATARLWVYLGDTFHPYNVFDFTATRKRDGPQRFLANFRGYLHADAFSGYDALYLPAPSGAEVAIIEVACNAHARRKFYEARSSDALRSHQALAYYAQLYEIERQARDWDDTQRLRMRQDLAVPILETFKTWLEAQRQDVLPKSPLGEAIGYAMNNWSALIRYTEASFLSIGRVQRWRGGLGEPCLLPTLSVVGARVAPHTPSPPPAPRTGRADFPHPALIRPLKPSHSAWLSDSRESRTVPVPHRGNGPGNACSPYRHAGSAASATCGNAARRTDGPAGTPCRPPPG